MLADKAMPRDSVVGKLRALLAATDRRSVLPERVREVVKFQLDNCNSLVSKKTVNELTHDPAGVTMVKWFFLRRRHLGIWFRTNATRSPALRSYSHPHFQFTDQPDHRLGVRKKKAQ